MMKGFGMNILVLGSGGREHAIAWALSKSPKCDMLCVAPGNGGTAGFAKNVKGLNIEDGEAVREGMTVRLAGASGRVDYVYESDGTRIVTASLDASEKPLPAGVYDVQIVTEALSPISFLLN